MIIPLLLRNVRNLQKPTPFNGGDYESYTSY